MVAGLLTLALGALALVGWMFGIGTLTAFRAGLIPMAPSTAVLFALFGGLLILDARVRPALAKEPWKLALAGVGTTAAATLLVLSSLGVSPGGEHLWFEISGEVAGAPVGHMSPLTAFGFVLAGAAYLLAVPSVGARRPRWAFLLGGLVSVLALTLTFAYLVSHPFLYGTGVVPPALSTSVAFLALGTGLLGLCGRRVWSGKGDEIQPPPALPTLGILALATFLVLTPGYLLFRHYAADFRTEIETQLLGVADLKVAQIESWLAERFSDASVFHGNQAFAELIEASLVRDDRRATREVEQWLREVLEAYDYSRIVVVDSAGRLRLTVAEAELHATDAPPGVGPVQEALRIDEVVIRDLHRDSPDGPIHVSIIAPVVQQGRALGAVVLRADPATKLFPTLQRWPTPSATGEILLVRREGDEVVFLNELRFLENAALDLRMPVSDRESLAARAVRGAEGVVVGSDYRGERAMAALRKVPGADWWLVAKMDVVETLGPLRLRAAWTVGTAMLLLLGVAGLLAIGWQRREKVYYRELARADRRHRAEQQEGRLRLEKEVERSQRYLDVAGVVIVVLDSEGRVETINRRGEEILGYPKAEIVGRSWFEHFIPEDQREQVREIHGQVIAGEVPLQVEIENEVLTRDGEKRLLRWRNAVTRDQDGAIVRTISSGLDITKRRRAEDELRRNEARYRNLFNSIRDAILVANTDREIIGCNPAFTDLFGYEEKEILGKRTAEVYASREEYESLGVELRENIGDPSFIRTVRYRKKSGEVFPGETNAFHLTEPDGEVVGFIGLIRDATQQLEARRALEESEARFRTLYEAAPVGIYRTRSDGEVLAVNQAMAEILGFDRPADVVHHYHELGKQLYRRPERRAEFLRLLREQGHVEDFEYEARRPDGETVWIENHARVAAENDDGTFEIEGFAIDVSEAKRREEDLRHRQKMLEQTEQIARIGSWELDVDTGEVTWSKELFRICGRDPDRGAPALGETDELFPPDDLVKLREATEQAVDLALPYDLHVRLIRTDGEIRHCRARGYPERGGDDRVVRLYGTLDDITERNRREEREAELQAQLSQAQKMESIGRLAGGVAHDFNNMLSVVLGRVELAQERLDPGAPLQRDLVEVQRAAERSAELTRKLLAFAREQVSTPEVLDLNETVVSMLNMLSRLIGENIELRWRPASEAWPVRMDPVQVDQVLTNLLLNARDAIEGTGRVTIETVARTVDEHDADTHPNARAGDYMVLSVTDTGAGMEPSVAERVFDPFFTTKSPGEGTGLGLAVVYGIVRQNDGFIRLQTEPGQGARFEVHLPRSREEATEPRERVREGTVAGTETVLVVEDQAAVVSLVEEILGDLGYTVLTAETPGKAIEIAEDRTHSVHLLITDVIMPEMDGRELSERLGDILGDIPVLYMSGYAEALIADRGVIEDRVSFLQKPFTRSQLSAKVRQALESR